jgi:two-component system phosphate regulon response regulator OmpR
MPEPIHLCLVDADRPRRQALADYLERHGLVVTMLASAEDLLQLLARRRPDLAVLAARLPGLDGLQACQRLRAGGDRLPVILAGEADDEVGRIVALELGADDCLRPPFSARELLARIHAVLRRSAAPPAAPAAEEPPVALGDWTFHAGARCLRRGGETRVLQTVEFALLAALTARPGQVLPRERLLANWQARPDAVMARSVDAAVMRLRKLIEPDPAAPRFIRTVRGHGYLFVPFAC